MKIKVMQEQTTYFSINENEAYRLTTSVSNGKIHASTYYCGDLGMNAWIFVGEGFEEDANIYTHEHYCEYVVSMLTTNGFETDRFEWAKEMDDIAFECAKKWGLT